MLKMKFFVFLLQLLTLTLSDDGSNCVDKYLYFEEQIFDNNSENRMKLYQAFYPHNDHLPYSVVVRLFFPMELESTSSLTPAALTDKCGCGHAVKMCDPITHFYCMTFHLYNYSLLTVLFIFILFCCILFIHCTTHDPRDHPRF